MHASCSEQGTVKKDSWVISGDNKADKEITCLPPLVPDNLPPTEEGGRGFSVVKLQARRTRLRSFLGYVAAIMHIMT